MWERGGGMPVLHSRPGKPGFYAEAEQQGRMVEYQLSPEGERFLTMVLSLRAGDAIRPSDFELLLDRGWATAVEPAEEVAEPAPPPAESVKPPSPEPAVAPPRATAARAGKPRRTRAREIALQVLYQTEQNPGLDQEQVDRFVTRRLQADRKLCAFAGSLIAGVREHQPRIDELITGVAENWRLDRMAAIDRNILRLGAYEMLYCPDVPRKVAINEALELAKRYSTAQSSRFVNGILDRLHTADAPAAPLPEPDAPAPPAADDGPQP